MKILFYSSVILTGFITIAALGITQHFAITFHPEGNYTLWSNGNPGLFFIMWPMLFILYFLFAMIFVFETWHAKWRLCKKRMIPIYTGIAFVIFSVTAYRVIHVQRQLESYFNVPIDYINPYSNHLIFNVWTILALLCLSAVLSYYVGPKKTTA